MISLKEMPKELIEQVVDLEANNMIPILKSSGIEISREEIKQDLMRDSNQIVLTALKNGRVIALLRYSVESDHLFQWVDNQ